MFEAWLASWIVIRSSVVITIWGTPLPLDLAPPIPPAANPASWEALDS
jgi:hypothetical protein